MTYRTPESLIREIMAKGHANLSESLASDNLNPALKTPEEERLTTALNVLKTNGVGSAVIKGNTVAIAANEMELAVNVLERSREHGLIEIKPQLASIEAMPMPEPHVPAPEFAKEDVEGQPDAKQEEDQTPEGKVSKEGDVTLEPRTLRNRMENQLKKVDEEAEQIDELSKKTLTNYVDKAVTSVHNSGFRSGEKYAKRDMAGTADHAVKSLKRQTNIVKAARKLAKEEVEQIDELSVKTHLSYERKSVGDQIDRSHVKDRKNPGDWKPRERYTKDQARKIKNRSDGEMLSYAKRGAGINQKAKVLAQEETELNELTYTKLKSYEKKGSAQVADSAKKNKLDARIARRASYVAKAREKATTKLKKAAFGEESNPVNMIVRVRQTALTEGLRLIGTHKSDSGKHEAKVYRDTEWNEHRVKFFIHGKHHEPSDYHTDDKHDAHHTAQAQLARLDKLNGALKEAIEAGEDLSWLEEDFDQLDELSKETLKSYIKKAGANATMHDQTSDHMDHLANKWSSSDNVEKARAKSNAHAAKSEKRVKGIIKAAKKLGEEAAEEGTHPFLNENVEQLDELKKVGAYTNDHGDELSIHRNPNDAKHLFVSHKGKVVDYHHGDPKDLHKKLTKDGFKGAISEEQIDEVSKGLLHRYVSKATKDPKHTSGQSIKKDGTLIHGKRNKSIKLAIGKQISDDNYHKVKVKATNEEVELTEAKADVEAAKKHLFKHPEANAIGKTMMGATKHFNYVQDAVDHVYNNHANELSYEDFDKIRPHLEQHFKKSGLK